MKKYIGILLLILPVFSCEKYPEPGYLAMESFGFELVGENQGAIAGEYLEDEVGIIAYYNSEFSSTPEKFHVEFTVVSGGGTLESTVVQADQDNKMTTRWKLGTEQNQQTVKGKIFDANGKFYSEVTIHATAFFLNKINVITAGVITSISDMVTDTKNHRSLIMAGYHGFYELGENFYDWRFKYNNSSPYITEIEINSKGILYSVNQDGKLFKSNNWGESWQYVGKPIPENNYSLNLYITSDDYIWVTKWDYGIYCSKDEGLTWQHDTLGLAVKEEMGKVFKLGNSHISVSGSSTQILQTFDDGITWKPINTPLYTHVIYVTAKNEIIACNEENGFSIYKSVDMGITYNKVLKGEDVSGNYPWIMFGNYGPDYYMLVPALGVYRTTDFDNFTQIMDLDKQNKLFIDHLGNIYAIGTNWANTGPDPSMVLPAGN